MKRRLFFPLALLILWSAGCAHDITSPANVALPISTGEAAVESFVTASVVTGWLHSCALTSQGTAYCWGDNGYGQLGSEKLGCAPGITCTLIPAPVRGGLTFTSLSAGAYHTCGITPNGELYCWGLNGDDQLGTETTELCIAGTYKCSSTPLRVASGIRSAEGGFTHTCALTTGGQPYCWGGNLFGQLGVNDTNTRSTPTAVLGQHTFASIEAGGYNSCALTASGVAYCWGANDKGQLGAPSSHTCFYLSLPYACNMTPIPVSGGLTFTSLDIGHQHTCGVVSSSPSASSAAATGRRSDAAQPTVWLASHSAASASPDVVGMVKPAPPSSLQASAVSSSQINLRWTDNSGNEQGFEVWRTLPGGQYTMVARLGPNVTSYSHTGLQPATTYTYGVVAFNASGFSNPSNLASATTPAAPPPPPPPPAAPSALQANAASSSQVNLTWSDNAGNEEGFRIERHAGDGNFTLLATVGANVTAYVNGSLAEGTRYTYRVHAFNAGGSSSWSNETSTTTWLNTPTNLAAQTMSSSQINLSWSDNSQRETGYEIQRRTATTNFAPIGTVGPNVATYGDAGLQASTTYTYRVRAAGSGTTSAWSNETSATTGSQAPPPPPVLPAAPSNLQASAVSSSQINLRWTDNSGNEQGFEVWRSRNRQTVLVARLGPNVTSFSDTGLEASTTYSYGVIAFNAAGNSNPSNPASATTHPASPPPAAPSALQANAASSSQVNLRWTDNAGNEEGFRIERRVGSGSFTLLATVGANATTFTDTNASPGSYSYRVQAYNTGGSSAYSNVATKPADPTNLTATAVSTNQIELTWSDNSNNEEGFIIERKTGDGAFVEITRTGANATSYLNGSLQTSTTYTYRVRAFIWEIGASDFTNEASATTHAGPTAGNVYCWGLNVRGQLGVNSLEDFHTTPTRVHGDLTLRALTAGREHTCGIAPDGRGYCWGWNADGQFGNGSAGVGGGSRVPVEMGFGFTWQEIRAGEKHSCGVSASGETFCWGNNHRGQVGNGTRNNAYSIPTPVSPPSP